MNLAIAALAAYLLGSIPNGLVFGRLIWGVDLRQHGSRNIGATNAWRTIGKGAGLLVFLLDFLKGLLAVWIASALAGTPASMVLAGILAILGHSCSLFLGFRGGKGVATGLGVIAMLMPDVTAIVFAAWLAIVFLTRYVSLGSIVAAALVPPLAWLFGHPGAYVAFGVLAAALIIFRHRANIGRLMDGTESKIRAAK